MDKSNKITYEIKTDLLTIEKVFDVLKECGLDHLLMGSDDKKELDTKKIFLDLFMNKKLRKLLNVITGNQVKETVEQEEAQQILQGFFLAFLKTWTMQNFLPQTK